MYRVSLSASNTGWNYSIVKLPHRKTAKGFVIERDIDKRLKDSDINVSKSNGHDSFDYMHRYAFCLEETSIKVLMSSLHEEILNKLLVMQSTINTLVSHVANFDDLCIIDQSKPYEKTIITDDMF